MACKEMCQMMGVFRLNPFTIYHASGQGMTTRCQYDNPGPLAEKPQLYEFQLVGTDIEFSSEEELTSLSPEFEVGNSSAESDSTSQNEWTEWMAREMPQPSWRSSAKWESGW